MEIMMVVVIGGAALVGFFGYIAKSLKKSTACNCSSKSCSTGNVDCGSRSRAGHR